MTLTEAVRIARLTLFEAGGIYLKPVLEGPARMVPHPDASAATRARCEAYNALADAHVAIGKLDQS